MPLFYVKIRKNIDICNYLPTYYPAICRGWGTFSVPSLGEGRGGAFGGLGRGFSQAAVFVPAPAGLFLPPTAAFFTVVIAGVMHRMTVGMAPMLRRKTCFPTGIGDITTKAKPPAVPTAFCDYFSPVWVEQIKAHSGMPTSSGNSVGVAFPQPRVAGEARYPG